MLGHINNVSFMIYFEQARVEFFQGYSGLNDIKNWAFMLASIKCDYKKQLYVNQSVVVDTYVTKIGKSSLVLCHELRESKTNDLAAVGESVLVNFDLKKQKSTPICQNLKSYLQDYDASTKA